MPQIINETKHSILSPDGGEIPNPTPVEVPARAYEHQTLQERIQRIMRTTISAEAAEQGNETFEESNDFDIDDSFDTKDVQSKYDLVEEEYVPPSSTPDDPIPEPEKPEPEAPETPPEKPEPPEPEK